MPADLHLHTTSSDSTFSPEQVIQLCAASGITTAAITDHDAVAGIDDATAAGAKLGVRVVAGVEMTAYVDKQEVHIVGLFINPTEPRLVEVLQMTRDERHLRVEKMVGLLRKMKINVTLERVMKFAGVGSPGRPHVAQALVECGQVPTIGDAFRHYIGSGGPAHIPKYQLSPHDAAETIHGAGGVAILAHPGARLEDSLVRMLITQGIDGIEVYHPLHDEIQIEHYKQMALDMGLLISGGSDSHGDINEGTAIGNIRLADSHVAEIEAKAMKLRDR